MSQPQRGRLIVVAGPSGVGKSTLVTQVARRCPQLWLSVSVTTRLRRPREIEGQDYFFVSEEQFEQLRKHGELLEWAEFAGNLYGTPRPAVSRRLEAGVDVLLEIDLAGVRQVREAMPEALTVFIEPPSLAELRRRLQARGTEDEAELDRRMRAASAELAAASEFDQRIVNTDLAAAVERLLALIGGQRA